MSSVDVVTVSPRYTEILAPLGNVQRAVDEAVRRYTIEEVSDLLAQLRREIRRYEEQFGCRYEVFYTRITTDEAFVTGLREQHSTWERDFHQWEFYAEELREWLAASLPRPADEDESEDQAPSH